MPIFYKFVLVNLLFAFSPKILSIVKFVEVFVIFEVLI